MALGQMPATGFLFSLLTEYLYFPYVMGPLISRIKWIVLQVFRLDSIPIAMSHPPTATEVQYANAILYASGMYFPCSNALKILNLIYFTDTVAAISLLLYDRILSLSDDVQYIWSRRMSYSKCIYLCQQYLVAAILLYFTIGAVANIIEKYT